MCTDKSCSNKEQYVLCMEYNVKINIMSGQSPRTLCPDNIGLYIVHKETLCLYTMNND